jgi:hypothetical protein
VSTYSSLAKTDKNITRLGTFMVVSHRLRDGEKKYGRRGEAVETTPWGGAHLEEGFSTS